MEREEFEDVQNDGVFSEVYTILIVSSRRRYRQRKYGVLVRFKLGPLKVTMKKGSVVSDLNITEKEN